MKKIGLVLGFCLIILGSVLVSAAGTYQTKKTSNRNLKIEEIVSVKESDQRIKDAYDKAESDFWVQSQGAVIKVLKDDTNGARHQRFLLRLSNGHSILIAHNIDIAQRIENLKVGDQVIFLGEYEWNNKGGVIHWTHHDPSERKKGGWLVHQGKRYQ